MTEKKYGIAEVFGPTIQGEGSRTGMPCVFVRLAGCNQWDGRPESRTESGCPFCDTDFRLTERLTAGEILEQVAAMIRPDAGVVLSGGEPMMQVDRDLVRVLKRAGYQPCIETNGTYPVGFTDLDVHVTLSPKVRARNLALHQCTDLKVLYPHPDALIHPLMYHRVKAEHRFIQPIEACGFAGADPTGTSVEECLKFIYENPSWRLSPQVHKLIGVQ